MIQFQTWQGIDDITGEPLIQRDDDKPETVRRRLENYQHYSTFRPETLFLLLPASSITSLLGTLSNESGIFNNNQPAKHHILVLLSTDTAPTICSAQPHVGSDSYLEQICYSF